MFIINININIIISIIIIIIINIIIIISIIHSVCASYVHTSACWYFMQRDSGYSCCTPIDLCFLVYCDLCNVRKFCGFIFLPDLYLMISENHSSFI